MDEIVYLDGIFKGKLINKSKNGVIKTDMDKFNCPKNSLKIVEVEDYQAFLVDFKRKDIENAMDKLEKELEKSDNKLFKITEDLVDYCKTTGYVPDDNTKKILSDRKKIRQDIKALQQTL